MCPDALPMLRPVLRCQSQFNVNHDWRARRLNMPTILLPASFWLASQNYLTQRHGFVGWQCLKSNSEKRSVYKARWVGREEVLKEAWQWTMAGCSDVHQTPKRAPSRLLANYHCHCAGCWWRRCGLWIGEIEFKCCILKIDRLASAWRERATGDGLGWVELVRTGRRTGRGGKLCLVQLGLGGRGSGFNWGLGGGRWVQGRAHNSGALSPSGATVAARKI